MWHVSSRSGVATMRTAIHSLLTYLLISLNYCRANVTIPGTFRVALIHAKLRRENITEDVYMVRRFFFRGTIATTVTEYNT